MEREQEGRARQIFDMRDADSMCVKKVTCITASELHPTFAFCVSGRAQNVLHFCLCTYACKLCSAHDLYVILGLLPRAAFCQQNSSLSS
jgi:hypothetical protein